MVDGVGQQFLGTTIAGACILVRMVGADVSGKVANFWLRFLIVEVMASRGSFNGPGSGLGRSEFVSIRTLEEVAHTYLLQ